MKRAHLLIAFVALIYSIAPSAGRAQSVAPAISHQLVLKDGRHAAVSGQKFMLVSPNGQLLPAPAGLYTLSNGVKLTVDASGAPHQVASSQPHSEFSVPSNIQSQPVQQPPENAVAQQGNSDANRSAARASTGVELALNKAALLSAVATQIVVNAEHNAASIPVFTQGGIWLSVTDDQGRPLVNMQPSDVHIEALGVGEPVGGCDDSRPGVGLYHFPIPRLPAWKECNYCISVKTGRPGTSTGEPATTFSGQILVKASYDIRPYWDGRRGDGTYWNP